MEFQHFDGETFIKMNALEIDYDKNLIHLAVTNRGRISVTDFDLLKDNNGYYFEYGVMLDKIYTDDFAEVA